MPDLIDILQQKIRANRLPEVDLERGVIVPAYDGLSLLNLPASLVRWLGAEPLDHLPVAIPLLDQLAEGIDQILMILVDALGFNQFRDWSSEAGSSLQPLINNGVLATLTSVAPSTTSSALTTLWTGSSPIEHGILGYELYLQEYGVVTNMITHNPVDAENGSGLLYQAGMDPLNFLPVETIGRRLGAAGVEVHTFLHTSIAHSGLSQMHFAGAQRHGFQNISDLWEMVSQLLQSPLRSKRYIWAYYGGIDAYSHRFGPNSQETFQDFKLLAQSIRAGLLGSQQPKKFPKTLLLLLSDHGQINSQPDAAYDLKLHPNFTRRLLLPPSGESRMVYLHPRPGQSAALEEYLHRTWPNQFSSISSTYLADKGLFGPGLPHPMAASRLGERTVMGHGQAYLWWPDRENFMRGRHGGLSEAEMLVPLLASRLD